MESSQKRLKKAIGVSSMLSGMPRASARCSGAGWRRGMKVSVGSVMLTVGSSLKFRFFPAGKLSESSLRAQQKAFGHVLGFVVCGGFI
jgi:hypothetical protein